MLSHLLSESKLQVQRSKQDKNQTFLKVVPQSTPTRTDYHFGSSPASTLPEGNCFVSVSMPKLQQNAQINRQPKGRNTFIGNDDVDDSITTFSFQENIGYVHRKRTKDDDSIFTVLQTYV